MTRLDERIVWFDFDALQLYDETDVGLFCLSDRDVSIILSCLRYTTWKARWYDGDGNRLRDVGRDADLTDAIERSERLIARLMADSCNDLSNTFDELIDALQALQAAGGGGCGCGGGGAGATDEPPSGSDWGNPEDPPDPGTPPDGFSDWDEYRGYKCDVATWILDSVISDVQWIQTIDLVGLAVTAFAFGLLTPIPGDELFALLSALLAALAISTGAITVLESALTTDYDDILCALYMAENAGQAKADAEAAMGTAIDNATGDAALRAMLKLTVSFWVNYVGINKMFDRDTTFESQLPSGDCSACGIPQWWTCGHGTVLDWGEDWVEVEAIASGSDWLVTRGLEPGPGFENTIIAGTFSPPAAVPSFASAIENEPVSPNVSCGSGNGSDWDITSGSFLGGPYPNAAHCLYRSGTQITVRFTKLT